MAAYDPETDPFLHGIFEPQRHECTDEPVTVVGGAIPRDLAGTYYRNGPNARFTPIGSYTFPLDGDGMVHAVTFAGGQAMYRNRFVRTPSVVAEERAGRALWGGLMTPIMPSAEEAPEMAGRYKDLPDVNVVAHGGRLLALAEGGRQFALDAALATVGPDDFGGRLPQGFTAHPKIDPASGEMIVFRYGFDEPRLSWAVIGKDGRVTRDETPIAIDATYMIHDFAVTPTWLVLFVCPLRFDLAASPPLVWNPALGTRIALVPRDGGAVRWIATDAFWVWHFANAFDGVDPSGRASVTVDFARWSAPPFARDPQPAGAFVRARLDPAARTARFETMAEGFAEFPRIDDRRAGLPYRYAYVAHKDGNAGPGHWNLLRCHDMVAGSASTFTPGAPVGEPIFAPAARSAGEEQGYVLAYRYGDQGTDLLVLRAAAIDTTPVAVLRMPQRVPAGLHGCFVPAA